MFKASRAALLLGLALLAGCGSVEDAPLERIELGTYIVTDFKMPVTARSAGAYGQRLLGKTVTLGANRILFPAEMDQRDCQHEGYRLTQRPLSFIQDFDLGAAGTLTPAGAEITDTDLIEVWNGCLSGAYLSVDHEQLYLPGRGALLVLKKL